MINDLKTSEIIRQTFSRSIGELCYSGSIGSSGEIDMGNIDKPIVEQRDSNYDSNSINEPLKQSCDGSVRFGDCTFSQDVRAGIDTYQDRQGDSDSFSTDDLGGEEWELSDNQDVDEDFYSEVQDGSISHDEIGEGDHSQLTSSNESQDAHSYLQSNNSISEVMQREQNTSIDISKKEISDYIIYPKRDEYCSVFCPPMGPTFDRKLIQKERPDLFADLLERGKKADRNIAALKQREAEARLKPNGSYEQPYILGPSRKAETFKEIFTTAEAIAIFTTGPMGAITGLTELYADQSTHQRVKTAAIANDIHNKGLQKGASKNIRKHLVKEGAIKVYDWLTWHELKDRIIKDERMEPGEYIQTQHGCKYRMDSRPTATGWEKYLVSRTLGCPDLL